MLKRKKGRQDPATVTDNVDAVTAGIGDAADHYERWESTPVYDEVGHVGDDCGGSPNDGGRDYSTKLCGGHVGEDCYFCNKEGIFEDNVL